MALSLSYNPTPSKPLRFVARLAPSWRGQATSGAEALWGPARRWRAWRTAASRRATGWTRRSATGCPWAAPSSKRRG